MLKTMSWLKKSTKMPTEVYFPAGKQDFAALSDVAALPFFFRRQLGLVVDKSGVPFLLPRGGWEYVDTVHQTAELFELYRSRGMFMRLARAAVQGSCCCLLLLWLGELIMTWSEREIAWPVDPRDLATFFLCNLSLWATFNHLLLSVGAGRDLRRRPDSLRLDLDGHQSIQAMVQLDRFGSLPGLYDSGSLFWSAMLVAWSARKFVRHEHISLAWAVGAGMGALGLLVRLLLRVLSRRAARPPGPAAAQGARLTSAGVVGTLLLCHDLPALVGLFAVAFCTR